MALNVVNGYVVDDVASQALADLTELMTNLPNATLISDGQRLAALNVSLIPDELGVWPGQPGYQPSYDIFWAAISLVGFLQAQPSIKHTASEGTQVVLDPPNWGSLVAYYRSMSPIAQKVSRTVLRPVVVPGESHVRKLDMHGHDYYDWRTSNGDVNTDVG